MRLAHVSSFFQLMRIQSSALGAAMVFVPLAISKFDIHRCAELAMPILLSSMSGFVLNDIHDVEKDKLNHPERPLPRGAFSSVVAVVCYFTLLAAALTTVASFVPPDNMFLYLLFLILITNYNYVVETFPAAKDIFVAVVTIIPLLIVQSITHLDMRIFIFSLFCFIFGRELLMDLLDSKGDGRTLVKYLGDMQTSLLGFGLQALGVATLLVVSNSVLHYLADGALAVSLAVFFLRWRSEDKRRSTINLMRAQLAVALILLY